MTRHARVLEPEDVRVVLQYARRTQSERNTVIVLLSFKAGLRACEIAGLSWPMVQTPSGDIAAAIDLSGRVTKSGRSRVIPLNRALGRALAKLHKVDGRPKEGPVIRSQRGGHMTARSLVNWFAEVYAEAGLTGCTSHSGRRTFVTRAARALVKSGGSLRDIQELVGHRSLSTTERYIQGDRAAQHRLVQLA
jgi:integrase/recombinase XerD